MFTHSTVVSRETYTSRGFDFDVIVLQAFETGDYQVVIVKNSFEVGDNFGVSRTVALDRSSEFGVDSVDELIQIAKDDIDRNEFDKY